MSEGATPARETGLMTIDGAALEYALISPAEGVAITFVLLHEGLGCVDMWRDFPERLAAATGRGVLCYSRQGYGRSDPASLPRPLSYMHDEGLDVLPQILEYWDLQEPILIGHSDGASIAAIYAGGVVDPRAGGLVLMAPHFFTEESGLASILASRTAFESDDLRERLERYHGDNVDCAFNGWNDAWLDPGFRDWNIEHFLRDIRMPVLVIQGVDDQYGTSAQVDAARAGCQGPVDAIMLSHCRHSPHRDSVDETLAAIARFAKPMMHVRPLAVADTTVDE